MSALTPDAAASARERSMPLSWWLAPAVLLAALLLETSDIDRAVSRWFYDS